MAGSFRAPLFILGLSNSPTSVQPGYRSLLAPWIGGATSTPSGPVVVQPGYRGFMALWIGGASNFGVAPIPIPPIPPTPPLTADLMGRDYWGRRIIQDDKEILELLPIIVTYLWDCD